MQPLFSSNSIPEYHDGMLFVQMRPSFAGTAHGAALGMAAFGEPTSSGVAAMAFYERAGLVKRVVPVARRPSAPAAGMSPAAFGVSGAFGPTATLMSAAAFGKGKADAGLSLVELERNEDVPKLQLALANDPNVTTVSRIPVRYLSARASASRRYGRAAAAAPKGAATAAVAPPDPSTMWNLRKIFWSEARGLPNFADASNVDVAVLDTGIDREHPDLQGRVVQYVWEHPDLPQASSAQDLIGHGTHVSGTIGAGIDNGLGINGICSCRIHVWKIFDDIPDLIQTAFGSRYVYFVDPVMYLRALLDCVEARVQVLNLSIGGPGRPSTPEAQAFQSLIENGTVVVAAMGNDREQGSPISYPAAIPGVIAVGATGLTDKVTTFSNRGNHISVCAPGESIWSTLPTYPGQLSWEAVIGPDGQSRQGKPQRREVNYDAWPGTSMATPHVTAAAALYLSNGGPTGGTAMRQALLATLVKVDGMGGADFSPDYGYGRLNLQALVRHAQQNAVA
jgi:subtilisin family serine protease